jgi:hypothetical protein
VYVHIEDEEEEEEQLLPPRRNQRVASDDDLCSSPVAPEDLEEAQEFRKDIAGGRELTELDAI